MVSLNRSIRKNVVHSDLSCGGTPEFSGALDGHKTLVVFFISSGDIALTPAPSTSFAVRHSSLCVSCHVSRL